MKPIAAAVAGALMSGVAMYTVGARTSTVDAFTIQPAAMQTLGEQPAPAVQLAPAPVAQPVVQRVASRPASRAVHTTAPAAPPARERAVVERAEPKRSWQKSALVIGGSAASGAGIGGIVNGKSGALIGAAIGGGAASIYEATKR